MRKSDITYGMTFNPLLVVVPSPGQNNADTLICYNSVPGLLDYLRSGEGQTNKIPGKLRCFQNIAQFLKNKNWPKSALLNTNYHHVTAVHSTHALIGTGFMESYNVHFIPTRFFTLKLRMRHTLQQVDCQQASLNCINKLNVFTKYNPCYNLISAN